MTGAAAPVGPVVGEGAPADAFPLDYVSRAGEAPRVLLFSVRNAENNRALVTQFEFEDVVCELDAVHMIAPRARAVSEAWSNVERVLDQGRLRLLGKPKRPIIPAQTLPAGPFDLFFAAFHFPWQLAHLNALTGWRERSRKAVCYLIEGWSKELPRYAPYLRLLDQFDQVFVLNRASIPKLREFTTAPLAFLPTATDTERFCPYPIEPARVVDVYSYGRRSPAAHAAMLALARRERFYYIYDTFGDASVPDFRAHRELLAGHLKRARYTISYPVNANRVARTGGEEALTTRYFEGAASGASMLGGVPATPEFAECFDWPDAVLDFPYEPADVRAELAALEAQADRLAAARLAGITNSLRRHDWMHRWAQVLDAAGLAPTRAMEARAARLEALARRAEADAGARPAAEVPALAPRPEPAMAGAGARPAGVAAAATLRATAPLQDSMFRKGGGKRCPNCSELNVGTASVCAYCGERL